MVGMAYAAVPLYAMFCQVTGYGGTTQRVEQAPTAVLDRKMTVRFDANVAAGLPWDFEPVQRDVDVEDRRDDRRPISRVTNCSTRRPPAARTFNVTPERPAPISTRSQCFCFTDTVSKPGETREMPVVFYVDPAIADDGRNSRASTTITLSYTFFPIRQDKPVAAAAETAI